ncbi:MAG TPA: hypothetical protein VHI31_04645 [Actinomycetota bacterium]|nr:hypothetical protein [Actinomycetota bacterium]
MSPRSLRLRLLIAVVALLLTACARNDNPVLEGPPPTASPTASPSP